jgi:hypothetical protein
MRENGMAGRAIRHQLLLGTTVGRVKTMSWHGYEDGQQVELEDILTTCEQYIASGKVVNREEKEHYLELVAACGHSFLIFSPSSRTGWGSTP